MSVIARFEVVPVRDGSMSTAIASALRALDGFPVTYRTTATDTIIEAESVGDVFAAVQAAHQAIPDDRVITSVEIDEDRRRPQTVDERVASVERELGHPARRVQPRAQNTNPPAQGVQPTVRGTRTSDQTAQPPGQIAQSSGQTAQPSGRQGSSPAPAPATSRRPEGRSTPPVPTW